MIIIPRYMGRPGDLQFSGPDLKEIDAAGGGCSDATIKLLLHANGVDGGTSFPDTSCSPHTMTLQGSCTTSTTQVKFGSASLHVPGTAASLYTDNGVDNADFGFGTGDFTIEFWLYPENTNARTLVYMLDPAGGFNQSKAWLYYNNQGIRCFIDNADRVNSGDNTMTFNAWKHIALTRASGVFRVFIDGVKLDEQTYSTDLGATGWCYLGNTSAFGNGLDGYMDDIRITKGTARYTANFTPPASEFPDP